MNVFIGHKYTADKCLREIFMRDISDVNADIRENIDTIMTEIFTKERDTNNVMPI